MLPEHDSFGYEVRDGNLWDAHHLTWRVLAKVRNAVQSRSDVPRDGNYMNNFFTYFILNIPSLERAVHVRNLRVEWPVPLVRLRNLRGTVPIKIQEMVGCRRPAAWPCSICIRQPPSLKDMASDIAFRFVLNLQNFKTDVDCRHLREGARGLLSLQSVSHLRLVRATGTARFAVAISQVLLVWKPAFSLDCERLRMTVCHTNLFIRQLSIKKHDLVC
jgi:hypothetical protein